MIMPHEVWDLIFLACLLLYFMSRESSASPQGIPPSSRALLKQEPSTCG